MKIGKSQKDLYIMYWLRHKPITYSLELFFFYLYAFKRDDVAEETYFILIELVFLEVGV